jgi:hypothetical protein
MRRLPVEDGYVIRLQYATDSAVRGKRPSEFDIGCVPVLGLSQRLWVCRPSLRGAYKRSAR